MKLFKYEYPKGEKRPVRSLVVEDNAPAFGDGDVFDIDLVDTKGNIHSLSFDTEEVLELLKSEPVGKMLGKLYAKFDPSLNADGGAFLDWLKEVQYED